MRIVTHDVPVLAGAGLGFIGVDDKIVRPLLHLFRHEGPFETGGESRPAAAAQAGLLHLCDDGIYTEFNDLLGAVPRAASARAVQPRAVEAVEIGENAVAIGKHQVAAPGGFWTGVSRS